MKSDIKGNRIGQKSHCTSDFESEAEGLAHIQGERNNSKFNSCECNGVVNAGADCDTPLVTCTASTVPVAVMTNGVTTTDSSDVCNFAAVDNDGAVVSSAVHFLVDQNSTSDRCLNDTNMNCNSTELSSDNIAFKAKLRVNVTSTEELEIWRKEFADRSKTTMRFANTGVCTGRKTLFKVILYSLNVESFCLFLHFMGLVNVLALSYLTALSTFFFR